MHGFHASCHEVEVGSFGEANGGDEGGQNRSLETQNRSFELLSTNLLRQVRKMLSQQHHDQERNVAEGRNKGDGEGSEGRGGGNNEGETEQRRFEPTRKLDIPIFSGDDVNG
ncbi:uncharacterized protein DS421_10g296790 [Arachis hypogaea]|nr:uncharacterized protein DS421_10g296790 [Arachis hypogaea]